MLLPIFHFIPSIIDFFHSLCTFLFTCNNLTVLLTILPLIFYLLFSITSLRIRHFTPRQRTPGANNLRAVPRRRRAAVGIFFTQLIHLLRWTSMSCGSRHRSYLPSGSRWRSDLPSGSRRRSDLFSGSRRTSSGFSFDGATSGLRSGCGGDSGLGTGQRSVGRWPRRVLRHHLLLEVDRGAGALITGGWDRAGSGLTLGALLLVGCLIGARRLNQTLDRVDRSPFAAHICVEHPASALADGAAILGGPTIEVAAGGPWTSRWDISTTGSQLSYGWVWTAGLRWGDSSHRNVSALCAAIRRVVTWALITRGASGGAGAAWRRLWWGFIFETGYHEDHVFIFFTAAPTIWQIETESGRLSVVGWLAARN